MPKLEYFVVSESVSVDQQTNNVSVFNIIEELRGAFPMQIPRLVATSCWHISPADKGEPFQATLRVRLDGESVTPELDDLKINFTTERDRHRVFNYVQGLKLSKPGKLEFEILLDGKHEAFHTVTVRAGDESE